MTATTSDAPAGSGPTGKDDEADRLASVYHDLRAPLAAMQAITEGLEDGMILPEHAPAQMRKLQLLAERLVDLASELSGDPVAAVAAPTAVEDLVRDAVLLADVVAAAKGVELFLVIDDAVAVDVFKARVVRALDNILDNAIRHTPAGGAVSLTASLRSGAARILIADACGGIPAADLTRLFERRFQGDDGDIGASGLGLFTARRLIDDQGGTITIDNEPPGCRVDIRLPLSE